METEKPQSFGPPPERVTTYIAPPEPKRGFLDILGNSTKNSRRGMQESRVAASITIDQPSTEESGTWLLKYIDGRDIFRDKYLKAAKEAQAEGHPARAIAYAKMAGEVKELSADWIVPKGMLQFLAKHYKIDGANETGYKDFKKWLKAINEADRRAFGLPPGFTDSVDSLLQEGRRAIEPDQERNWHEALDYFIEQEEYHPAGIATFELGKISGKSLEYESAAEAFYAAYQLFDKASKQLYDLNTPAEHTAEAKELRARYDQSLESVVLTMVDKTLNPQQQEMLRDVLTSGLKIGGLKLPVLSKGYRTLAENSSGREKHKYKGNVRKADFQEASRKASNEAFKNGYGAYSIVTSAFLTEELIP